MWCISENIEFNSVQSKLSWWIYQSSLVFTLQSRSCHKFVGCCFVLEIRMYYFIYILFHTVRSIANYMKVLERWQPPLKSLCPCKLSIECYIDLFELCAYIMSKLFLLELKFVLSCDISNLRNFVFYINPIMQNIMEIWFSFLDF